PGVLEYSIETLPDFGVLQDPNTGQMITEPNTELAGYGNKVIYVPNPGYTGSDYFTFTANDGGILPQGGVSNLATISIDVTTVIYAENMDSDPNIYWDFDPGEGDSCWAWGTPTGGGGQYCNPDPTSGYTGVNVIGYNLNGDYRLGISETEWATLGPIDCSQFRDIKLCFYRWTNIYEKPYDYADIEISIGNSWNQICDNFRMTDSCWVLKEIDISEYADGQSSVYIRWGIGPTNGSYSLSGWNIDDVELRGVAVEPCDTPGDFEPDCDVDMIDLGYLMDHWLDSGCDDTAGDPSDWCFGADLNRDGTVNLADLGILACHWLETQNQ
ncbi:MAG: hypothetical protein JW810_13870, partial [Sedimentisphaerales bacterium]|nr:hypothetical protein [Sedimentisphaerales bacterium]